MVGYTTDKSDGKLLSKHGVRMCSFVNTCGKPPDILKEGKWASNFIVVVGLVDPARPSIYHADLTILKVYLLLFSIFTTST